MKLIIDEVHPAHIISADQVRSSGLKRRFYDPIDGGSKYKNIPRRCIVMYQWGRDCDMCESDSITIIAATRRSVMNFINHVYEGAEGPTNVHSIPLEEAKEFKSSFRDRILEAREEGEHYNV